MPREQTTTTDAVSPPVELTAETLSLEVRLAQRLRPTGRPAMYHSWRELLFLHWRFSPAVVQQWLPSGLTVDTYDSQAWIGIVPFLMRNIRPWWSPVVPGISNFEELNLRTYVINEQGIPGVWFFSLDANTRIGVWCGKNLFGLPYFYAQMTHECDPHTGCVRYRSLRPGRDGEQTSNFTWQPRGKAFFAEPGSLEFFLIERYVLFAKGNNGRIAAGRVHHPPYEVSAVDATMNDSLFAVNGLPRPDRTADHALVCRGVDVEVFPLQSTGSFE